MYEIGRRVLQTWLPQPQAIGCKPRERCPAGTSAASTVGSVLRDLGLDGVQEEAIVRFGVGPFGPKRSECLLGHVDVGLRGEYDGTQRVGLELLDQDRIVG